MFLLLFGDTWVVVSLIFSSWEISQSFKRARHRQKKKHSVVSRNGGRDLCVVRGVAELALLFYALLWFGVGGWAFGTSDV